MIETVRLRPAKRSTAFDCTEGVSAPGTQALQRGDGGHRILDAGPAHLGRQAVKFRGRIDDVGRLPRRLRAARPSPKYAAAHRPGVLMKSSCDPSIIAAIMIEKPTPVMTPAIATSVWRAR